MLVHAQSCLTLCNPVDCSPPGSLSMEFSRQEYWSGLPFPSPGDLPDPGIKPRSPTLQADSLTSEPPGKPTYLLPQGKSLQLSMATLGFGLPQWLSGKESPAMQETLVQFLGWEDPLKDGMATHPLQYSCLENPHGQGAWWATVHRVSRSRTRLSNTALSSKVKSESV